MSTTLVRFMTATSTPINDEIVRTHSYFLMGMLFEKLRSEQLYSQVYALFLLHHAYLLQKKYSSAPEPTAIWKYLTGMKISSAKEQKKLQLLFCYIAFMQDFTQFGSRITFKEFSKYFSSYVKKDIHSFEEISFPLIKETQSVLLESIPGNIQVLTEEHPLLQKYPIVLCLLANISIPANGLMPYSYLGIDLMEGRVTESAISKALEKCTRQFDELKQMYTLHMKRIKTLGRVAHSAEILYAYLLKKPVITAKDVEKILKIAKPNASLMIDRFIEIGILSQVSIGERNRIYGNYELLRIFDLHQI